MLRLGAPLKHDPSPEAWIEALQAAGYTAAYCPLEIDAPLATIQAYRQAAEAANIVIAEVGAWSNPISPDDAERKAAMEKCKASLALADEIGARCCVNISGSRSDVWDAPHEQNLTFDTFDLVVASVQEILTDVKPKRTYYTLEAMPWMFPHDLDAYLDIIHAIKHPQFAVHLDPVNWITNIQAYYHNSAFLNEMFDKLGPYIKSCHAKDMVLRHALPLHIEEVRPGLGTLDYKTFLHRVSQLDNVPIMLEHLPMEEYTLGFQYIVGLAD